MELLLCRFTKLIPYQCLIILSQSPTVGWISEEVESNHSSILATTVDEPGGE